MIPTGIGVFVLLIVFVAVSITETVLLSEFVTYTVFPFGLTAAPTEWSPTITVAVTVLVEVLITETLLLP